MVICCPVIQKKIWCTKENTEKAAYFKLSVTAVSVSYIKCRYYRLYLSRSYFFNVVTAECRKLNNFESKYSRRHNIHIIFPESSVGYTQRKRKIRCSYWPTSFLERSNVG